MYYHCSAHSVYFRNYFIYYKVLKKRADKEYEAYWDKQKKPNKGVVYLMCDI